MKSKASLTVTTDFTTQFNDIIKKFRNDQILVGIPEEDNDRKEKDEGPIGNAALLAINNFGSQEANIPARPVMKIGIRNAQGAIAEQMRLATIAGLSRGFAAISTFYHRAGIIASNSIKKAITDQDGIAPLAQSTLDSREAEGFKGTKALIRTGQMRNAITYVVKGED